MSIWESTVLYLIVFILTCLFTYRADKRFDTNKRTAVFLSVIAVLIPSVLAGVRDDTVGKDVLEYAVRTFNYANSAASFSQMRQLSKEPVGYQLTAYISSFFSNNAGAFLFSSQLLVVTPVYISAYKCRDKYPMWLTMCSYMFLFYNFSLNIMKQSISAAFMMLCCLFIKEKKYVKAGVCFAIALSFHNSSVIGLMFIIFALIVTARKETANKVVLIVGFFVALVFLKEISSFMLERSLLPEKYTRNINAVFDMNTNVYLRINGFNFHVFFDWMFRVLLVLVPVCLSYKVDKDVDETVKYINMIGLIFYTYVLFAFKTVYGNRISVFCDIFQILLVPELIKVFRRKKIWDRVSSNAVIISFMGIYWFVWVMIYGASASNYFKFRF